MKFNISKMDILQSFKSRKFKYGGYATLLTLIVIAALIIVNLVADLIPVRMDLTWNKMYSLSDQTHDVLDNLQDDIMIHFIGEQGSADQSSARSCSA